MTQASSEPFEDELAPARLVPLGPNGERCADRAVLLPTDIGATFSIGRTAAAVVLASTTSEVEALRALGHKLAMHVVAAAPLFVDRDGVDAAAVQRERDILLEQAQGTGKPEHVIEKMVTGRLTKYYQEVCLLEQTYLIDDSAGTVAKVLAAAGKDLGAPVEVRAFVRYQVGDESSSG